MFCKFSATNLFKKSISIVPNSVSPALNRTLWKFCSSFEWPARNRYEGWMFDTWISGACKNESEGYECLVYHDFKFSPIFFFLLGGEGAAFKSAIVYITFENFQFEFEVFMLSNIISVVWQTPAIWHPSCSNTMKVYKRT